MPKLKVKYTLLTLFPHSGPLLVISPPALPPTVPRVSQGKAKRGRAATALPWQRGTGGWQAAQPVTPRLSSLTPRMQGPAWYSIAALPVGQWPPSISRCLNKLPRLVPLAACGQPSAGPGRSHQDDVPNAQKVKGTPCSSRSPEKAAHLSGLTQQLPPNSTSPPGSGKPQSQDGDPRSCPAALGVAQTAGEQKWGRGCSGCPLGERRAPGRLPVPWCQSHRAAPRQDGEGRAGPGHPPWGPGLGPPPPASPPKPFLSFNKKVTAI